jgi:hypothetical protein
LSSRRKVGETEIKSLEKSEVRVEEMDSEQDPRSPGIKGAGAVGK